MLLSFAIPIMSDHLITAYMTNIFATYQLGFYCHIYIVAVVAFINVFHKF